ncbi:MAG TPA: FtsW/RodA/SpoVE family cell cycle protein [Anaerolineales bacterium]|nr:FtsW/RodA/SpoVE family cell cycle protein [Anaerolineales bacterium]
MFRSNFWRHFDFWLLGAMIIALVFGVTMIRSAIAGNVNLANVVPRQIIYGGIGLVVIVIVSAIDYRFWSGAIVPMYIVITIALALLRVVGGTRFGATRWIETGLVSIQPTELAKIVVILALANYFAVNQDAIRSWGWLAKSLLITLGIAGLIFIQPNLSNVIVVMVLWAGMIWVSGLDWKHILIMVAAVIVVVVVGFQFIQGYQQQRIINFINPDQSARNGATYNVIQALIALGSGGWVGKGYGHGTQTQLRFMKVRHTDFIFSVIGEELGFVGAIFVLVLLGFIIYRCLRTARIARDPFGALIAYGVAILIFFQAVVNIAVNLNLIPVTGVPLPFISYGGSGLISLMLGVGLVESVAIRHKPLDF